jgi:hypothetical protein
MVLLTAHYLEIVAAQIVKTDGINYSRSMWLEE